MQLTVPVTLSRDGFACLPVGNNKNKKTQKLKNTKTQKLKNSKKNSTSFPKNSHFFLLPSFSPLSFFLKLDWIDSPFIGQGHAPNGTTKVCVFVFNFVGVAKREQQRKRRKKKTHLSLPLSTTFSPLPLHTQVHLGLPGPLDRA